MAKDKHKISFSLNGDSLYRITRVRGKIVKRELVEQKKPERKKGWYKRMTGERKK